MEKYRKIINITLGVVLVLFAMVFFFGMTSHEIDSLYSYYGNPVDTIPLKGLNIMSYNSGELAWLLTLLLGTIPALVAALIAFFRPTKKFATVILGIGILLSVFSLVVQYQYQMHQDDYFLEMEIPDSHMNW
jgi:hypothetical protein